jgi:hypothetical protein
MTSYRERDVREAIQSLLDVTGKFDGVYLSGSPEDRGERSSDRYAAVVEPDATSAAAFWDDPDAGAMVMTATVALTVVARHEDPEIRDEAAELLLNTAADVLNGRSLAGLTLPGFTRVRSWTWLKPHAPERRIAAKIEYQYLVEPWSGLDLSE